MKRFFVILMSALLLVSLAAMGETVMETAYTEEIIMIDGGDHQIPATLTLPKGTAGNTYPAVLMLHGNGSDRHEAGGGYDLLAPMMAEKGIASLRFDYIGNGESAADYIEFTHEKGVEDALASFAYMLTQPAIDSERIGIMGWSQGGGLALVTAGREERIKSVLTWAGALYDGSINEDEYAQAKEKGFYESIYDWRESLKLSPAYFEVLKNFIVADAIPLIKAPILAINGSLDTAVPPETGETIANLAVNEASKALILEGADHTFNIFTGNMDFFNKLMEDTINWFADTL